MKPFYITLIAILSIITSIAPAKEEPLKKLEDVFAVTASPKDWHIESVSILKNNQPKELIPHFGDYLVTIKIRNISNRPIKIDTTRAFSSYIRPGQLTSKELLEYHKYREVFMNQCCHPAVYTVIAPNDTYTGSCRNLSKYEGKIMNLTAAGVTIGSYTVKQGHNTFKQNKVDNNSQQSNH